MAIVKVTTNFNIELEFEVPEFYRRLFALIIDFIVFIIYRKIAYEILMAVASGSDFGEDRFENMHWLSIVLIYGPIIIYYPLMEITMNGQTVGKKIMQIQVVNENGGKASISQICIRWLIRDIWFVFLLGMGLYQGYAGSKVESWFLVLVVMAYFITDLVLVVSSKKGQRLGDLLAKTILIRVNKKGDINETVFQEVADNYIPSFPQIMQLSDRDLNAMKSILESARKRGDYNMAEEAAAKIKAHLKIETNMSAFDFLEVLLKDYNYLSVK